MLKARLNAYSHRVMSTTNIIAFGLRGGSALAKLVFVSYLGYFSYNFLLGQFVVFVTITAVFTQVAGLEINQTIGRKFHALSQGEQKQLFQHQAIASLGSYIILSSSIVVMYYGLLESYWIAGVFILYLEHYTTELYRLYIIKLRPLKASLLIFTKNFGWVILFVLLHHLELISASIEPVLLLWLVFLLLSSIIWNPKIEILGAIKNCFHLDAWPKKTWRLVWSSRLFILSAISIACIGAVDKLIIAKYFGTEQLGRYYLYQTIASMPALVISFSIGATIWPKCIKLAATGNKNEYAILWKKLNNFYIFVITVLSLTIAIVTPVVLNILDRPLGEPSLLYILIASNAAFVLCEPYKLNLYTGGKDRALVIGNVTQLLLVIAFVAVGLLLSKIEAVAAGILIANTLSLLLYRCQIPKLIDLLTLPK